MKSKLMYIELKSHAGGHDDKGFACISRVTLSKTGKTIYWRDKTLHRDPCKGGCGNHYDPATDETYWISGPKKNGTDRYYWGKSSPIEIDKDVREEYWTEIRNKPEKTNEKFA